MKQSRWHRVATWALPLIATVVGTDPATAREWLPLAATPSVIEDSGEITDNHHASEAPDVLSLGHDLEGYVAGRHIAVLSLAEMGNPRSRRPGEIRQMIEDRLGYQLPQDAATDADLRRQAIAAYDNFGGAYVRELPDGRQYCVAMIGRPVTSDDRFIATIAGGLPFGAAVRPEFAASAAGILRFLAFHEIGGHCADPALTPATGTDKTAFGGYQHSLAEMRADIFATLATAREDGNTDIAQAVLTVRRAYSLQAAIVPSCPAIVNDGAIYQTGPGISAAIAWANQALSISRKEAGSLQELRLIDLLTRTDRLLDEVKPSFEQFLAFDRRIDAIRAEIGTATPISHTAQIPSFATLDSSARAWLTSGADAIGTIFQLPATQVTTLGPAPSCPPKAPIVTRADKSPVTLSPSRPSMTSFAAGLGG